MGLSRASKNLAHMLAKKHDPLHYKRIPFEKVRVMKPKPNVGQAAEMDRALEANRRKGRYSSGVGVGY